MPISASATQSPLVRNCAGTSLVGAPAFTNVSAGNTLMTFVITNVGIASCRIGGFPQLYGVRDNRRYKVNVYSHATQGGNLHPTVLLPRMSGAFILDVSDDDACAANGDPDVSLYTYTGEVLILPDKDGQVEIGGSILYAPCGLADSQLGWAKGFRYN